MFRMPLWLYHRGWGWMLAHTFMLLVHIGRTTGRPHETVAMVLADDPDTRAVVICSGWGPDVDWVRNLRAGPAQQVRIVPEHRFLSDDEAFATSVAFRRRHPRRMRLISTILGWGDLRRDDAVRTFVTGHPFIAFRPTTQAAPDLRSHSPCLTGPPPGSSTHIRARVYRPPARLPAEHGHVRQSIPGHDHETGASPEWRLRSARRASSPGGLCARAHCRARRRGHAQSAS
jgi:deazaflavin-dependent oxidoreductase (nitroreductase family)